MKLKPYPEYKDSGVEWIGDIPVNWKASKIKFVSFRVSTGKTPPSESPEYYDNNDLDWFTPGDLGKKLELTEASKKISKLAIFDNKAIKFKPLSVLIVGIGATLGKIGITKEESSSNQQINAIEFDPNKIIPKYGLYYLLGVKDHIISLSNASTIGIFNQTQTENFQLLNPPLKEQSIIYSFLDKKTSEIDLTIEKDTQLTELLKEKRTALINHAVTKGLDPTAEKKDSGVEWIGEIPEEWEVKKIKEINDVKISNVDKKSKKNEPDILLCNYTDVYNNEFITSKLDFMKATASVEQVKKLTLQKGDVIITKDSETQDDIAVPALVDEDLKNVVCGYHLALIRPHNHLILGDFLFRLLQSKKINDQFVNAANGVTRFGISTYPIKNSYLIVPPIDRQEIISRYLDQESFKIDLTIQKIQQNIELLEEYKKSLIHHVVTGKVDVREVAI